MKVLIVEDNPDTAGLLAHALKLRMGLGSDIAESAEAALAMIPNTKYAAVILDLVMPGKGGMHFLRNYEHVIRYYLPVIVLTGHPDVESVLFALTGGIEAPAAEYLQKPVDLAEIERAIKRHVRALAAADIRVDLSTGVACAGDQPLDLRPMELALLAVFVRFADRTLNYADMVQALGEGKVDYSEAKQRLASTLSNLRKAIRQQTGEQRIKRVGKGTYRLV